jgi:hypothetical protein
MKTKLASAFGLAMLSVAFSFGTSLACPETSQTTASAVEITVSESGTNVTALVEVSAPEEQVGEVGAPASIAGNIEAPSAEPSGLSIANAIPVEITVTATVVVPGQNSDDEGPATPAGIAGTEPFVTEAFSQAAAPESEAKATADSSAQTGAAKAQIEVAEPPATVAAVEPPSTDVTAPPAIVFIDAVPVEINVTVTVVVPGQTLEAIDEVEITGPQPEHPISAPNLKRDEANAALDNEE